MLNIRTLALALSLAVPTSMALADEAAMQTEMATAPTAESTAPQPAESSAPTHPYLGVRLMRVPPPLAAQLPESVARGQGVVIMRVQPDSPAARAGLQRFDILTGYDDQRLFTPGQLSALVKSDEAGREVKLQFARGGKLMDMAVTLGERAAKRTGYSWGKPHPQHPYMGAHPWKYHHKKAWAHCHPR